MKDFDVGANRSGRKWTRREQAARVLWGLAQPLFQQGPQALRIDTVVIDLQQPQHGPILAARPHPATRWYPNGKWRSRGARPAVAAPGPGCHSGPRQPPST